MSIDVQKFYKLLSKDEVLIAQLKKKAAKVSSEDELVSFLKNELIPAAKKRGLNVTLEDFINYEKEKLEFYDLENVSGGISAKALLTSAGIFSLMLLGASFGAEQAHADVPQDVVIKSANELSSAKEKVELQEQEVPSIASGVADKSESENASKEEKSASKSTEKDEWEMSSEEEKSGGEILEEEKTEVVDSIKNIDELEFSDKAYAVNALNLVDPFINNLTGVTENSRFLDGSKETISVNAEGRWQYGNDAGKGFSDYMSMLYPSRDGRLNVTATAGGASEIFERDCKPASEMIADIICYFHNKVRKDDEEGAKLDKLIAMEDNELRKIIIYPKIRDFLTAQGISKDENYTSDYFKKIKTDVNFQTLCISAKLGSNLNKSKVTSPNILNKIVKDINALKGEYHEILPSDHFIKMMNNGSYSVNLDSFRTVLKLLKAGSIIIKEQEQRSKDDKERILPKYTAEKMLLSFFLKYKNTKEDVDAFYKRVSEKMIGKLEDSGDAGAASDALKWRSEVLSMLEVRKNSPYTLKAGEYGHSYRISAPDGEGKICFKNNTFADCADTAAKHTINLLAYDKESQWSRLIKDAEKEALQTDLDEIMNAMGTGKSVTFYPLEKRLKLFYLYQSQLGADTADTKLRSLWNYAICNMNNDANLEGGELFQIKYKSWNYELLPGYTNELKILYNIAHALKLKPEQEASAKEKINELAAKKTDKTAIIDAIKTVFGLFNDKVTRVNDGGHVTRSEGEWFGKVSITLESGNNFVISQTNGHAYVTFDPAGNTNFTEYWRKLNKANLKKDEFAAMLVNQGDKSFNPRYLPKFSTFNMLYADNLKGNINEKIGADKIDEKYFNNYKALRFFKELQGEEENRYRVVTTLANLKLNPKKVTVNCKKQEDKENLAKFLIEQYKLDKLRNCSTEFYNEMSNTIWIEFLKNIDLEGENFSININGIEFYCIIEDGGVTIYPIDSDIEEITIPKEATFGETTYKVKGIGEYALCNSKIKSIKFEDGFDSLDLNIRYSAFRGCDDLKEFTSPPNVTNLTIGKYAFFGCTKLTKFTIQAGVTNLSIRGEAFFRCKALTEFTIPIGITTLSIEDWVFNYCEELNKFTIPASVTTLHIGGGAFCGCSELRKFKIPTSVTTLSIGDRAFIHCRKLTKFTILAGVTNLSIGKSSFYGCEALTEITIPAGVTNLSIGKNAFYGCEALTEFTIPAGVTTLNIEDDAFDDYTKLTKK